MPKMEIVRIFYWKKKSSSEINISCGEHRQPGHTKNSQRAYTTPGCIQDWKFRVLGGETSQIFVKIWGHLSYPWISLWWYIPTTFSKNTRNSFPPLFLQWNDVALRQFQFEMCLLFVMITHPVEFVVNQLILLMKF